MVGDVLRQAVAFDELRDHVIEAIRLAKVVHRHDVGVIDAGDGLGFTLEALDELGVVAQRLIEDLHRNNAIEADLPTFVDQTHAALADFLHQFVIAEHSTEVGIVCLHRFIAIRRHLGRWQIDHHRLIALSSWIGTELRLEAGRPRLAGTSVDRSFRKTGHPWKVRQARKLVIWTAIVVEHHASEVFRPRV